ncbi:MAG: VCBS repeat-containing protein, partial [Pyrinomonadaceae bacterium]
MLVPAVLIGDLGPVRVRAANNLPAPVSAPPEHFSVGPMRAGSDISASFAAGLSVAVLNFFGLGVKAADTSGKGVGSESDAFAPPSQSLRASYASSLTAPPPAGSVRFDFDGDGKADIGRWHATTTEFKVKNSLTGTFTTNIIGTTAARSCPADFDGDGKTDQAVFYTGTWKIKKSSNSTIQTITGFGQAGDIPLPGNYRGSTAIDAAVFRPSNNT